MLIFQYIDFSLIVLDLLIHIIELFFQYIGRTLIGDQLVLSFGRGFVVFVFIEHFVDLDDFIFQFTVAFLQLLDVFGSE